MINKMGKEMKVKMFEEYTESSLEEEINKFLIGNVDLIYTIKYSSSTSPDRHGNIKKSFSAMIIYNTDNT